MPSSSTPRILSKNLDVSRDELYRLLARNLPDTAVFLLDAELRILVAEGQALNEANYTSQALEGLFIGDVLSDGNDDLIGQYRDALKEHKDSVRTYEWQQGHYQVHAIPVQIGGNARYLMVVANNITRQVEAQTTIANAERRTRTLLSALPDAMFVTNQMGIVTEIQIEDELAFVLPSDNIGKPLNLSGINPLVAQKAMSALQDTFQTRRTQSYEYEVRHNNEDYHFQARTLAVNDQEAITLVRDVSLYRRTARSLTERNHDLEILRAFDQDLTQVLSVNYVLERAGEYLLPVTEATCVVICLLKEGVLEAVYWHGVEKTPVEAFMAGSQALMMELIESRQPRIIDSLNEALCLMMLPDNHSTLLMPIITADNAVGLVVLEKQGTFSARHVSSVEHMINRMATGLENARLYEVVEAQLNEMQQLYAKVQRLEQIKTDMIRIASHDLKNPLMGIRGYLEMLTWDTKDVLNDDQKHYLTEITNAAERMQQMIYGILSLDRIQQMADNALNEKVNMNQLTTRVIHEQQASARHRTLTFHTAITDQPIIIIGDMFQLQEALMNIISNAIKYTPDGGRISITLETNGSEAIFRVEDTGYGIPQPQHDRLFTPFFRAKTKENTAVEGTGLGLHLVKNIVTRYQGQLIFESEYGKGSTFGFRLPLAKGSDSR